MAVYESKQGLRHPAPSIAVMMIVAAVILINANCGGATVLVRSNVTFGCITGREEACLIAEDLELEWSMEYSSHVARVLAAIDPKYATQGANKATNVPCVNGKGKPYNCNTEKTKKKAPNCRSPYDRTRVCVR